MKKKQYILIQRDRHNDPREWIVESSLEAARIIKNRDNIEETLPEFVKRLETDVEEDGAAEWQGLDDWEFRERTYRDILNLHYTTLIETLREDECAAECLRLGLIKK